MDDNTTASKQKRQPPAGPRNPRCTEDDATQRTAARKVYRAKIKSLLGESKDKQLADVWQRVCPLRIDPARELPDRRGIIEDLADFAEVLQPSLSGMKAQRLCLLVEKYAACESRHSGSNAAKSLG